MTLLESSLVRRSPIRMAPDPSRVVTRLFVPGHEGFDQQESRSNSVLQSVLELPDEEVQQSLDDILARFNARHHGLTETFIQHADELADRLNPERQLSPARRLLLGATFTSEYAIEGAALCNPSMVIHPDQSRYTRRCPFCDERPSHRRGSQFLDRLSDRHNQRLSRR